MKICAGACDILNNAELNVMVSMRKFYNLEMATFMFSLRAKQLIEKSQMAQERLVQDKNCQCTAFAKNRIIKT